jgi:hypothetical protein
MAALGRPCRRTSCALVRRPKANARNITNLKKRRLAVNWQRILTGAHNWSYESPTPGGEADMNVYLLSEPSVRG